MEVDTGAHLTSSPALTSGVISSIQRRYWDHAFSDVIPDPTGTVLPVERRKATVYHTPSDAGAMALFESGAGRHFGVVWNAFVGRISTPDDATDSYYTPNVDVLREWDQGTLDKIEDTLYQDRNEAILEGESGATEAAIATCRKLAGHILDFLTESAKAKWAAFGEDSGSVSLVLRSDVTGRRVDFRVSSEGQDITVISIDKDLNTSAVPLALGDRSKLRESAAWVHGPQ